MSNLEAASVELACTATVFGGIEVPLMWWSFVARTHDEIVEYRRLWQGDDPRFGAVSGYSGSVARLRHHRCRPRGCGRVAAEISRR